MCISEKTLDELFGSKDIIANDVNEKLKAVNILFKSIIFFLVGFLLFTLVTLRLFRLTDMKALRR